EEDLRPIAGNYVILEGSSGFALFAHLKPGSVNVSAGQQVKCGDVLGNVGHSGNSTMPHLHFQMMDNVNPLKAEGILCKFDEFETMDNGEWISKADTVPDYMKRIRV
ncbi:MAG TPA: M23 family metallopeptidase, partial [Clostridia bacterium]|nr:M23 family metallopeptidase [Clostridia bacterium]